MLNQYYSNVRTTIDFLRLLNVKVNDSTVNETLQNHPDWPSLLCIADSLSLWNIPNGAGKINPADIDQLTTPFIAYFNESKRPLVIVTEVSENEVLLYKKNYKNRAAESKDEFIKKWEGVYLIAQPTERSGELKYQGNRKKAIQNLFLVMTAFIVLALLPFVFFNTKITGSPILKTLSGLWGIYLQYYILLSGVFITSLLLWYEIDKNNPLLQKVCTGIKIKKANCNAILTGKQAKVFSWLSWSEVGFFYFAGGLLSLAFVENAIILLAWINILALSYTVFSIYYQWRVANQWCLLCLAVQILLVLGGINIIANNLLYAAFQYPLILFLKIAILFTVPVLIWYLAKPHFLRLQDAKKVKREYLRIKFKSAIYKALFNKQKVINTPVEGLGIDFGNPAASNTIIKVCNPYCFYCKGAHSKIEELLEHNKNVKVKVIFKTYSEPDPSIIVVKHFLAIAEENNEAKTRRALDEWYLARKTNYEVFSRNYKMNGELEKQGKKVSLMKEWCQKEGIPGTPTIFLNGIQLPDAYNVEDLQYFLSE